MVAVYVRVSTSKQLSDLEAQKKSLEAFCLEKNLKNFKIFEDFGISGAKSRRPGLDNLMEAVRSREVTHVIVYSFSRLARSTSHLLSALEVFNSSGVHFVSLSESVDTSTPTGKMIFTVLASVAELERDLIVERIR